MLPAASQPLSVSVIPTKEEFKWRKTYIRDRKKLHNFLQAINRNIVLFCGFNLENELEGLDKLPRLIVQVLG